MAIGAEVGVYSTYFWNAGGSASELWDGAGVIPRAACDIFNYVHETVPLPSFFYSAPTIFLHRHP